jgi:hypothetical protein
MVKTRSRPPESMRKTKTARAKLKMSGREGWIFFNPTRGTYQSRKMRKKRIKQVKTKSPIKILFCGLTSKRTSRFIAECGLQNAEWKKTGLMFRNPQSEIRNLSMKDCANRDGVPG